VSNPLL